ncbi:T9SS type A sorting domain-containing protein [Reichenbachiella carrageenanivorans]|uniref:T9SS type A sorting domain-containing protein n=1 Tax=Reichenbachiella carrageenanivorans TaxID=2979869 RepID=A0ABY6D1L8_9BACT|nr:T9SS type A sorting domain-containing protein [Reichenbachiella carrageenanivorans]UXX79624.1 T9SS type A sorting domain-containing protein [Reichenbachiella carrageenanivorans]
MKKPLLLFSALVIISYSMLVAQEAVIPTEEKSALTFSRPEENTLNYNNKLVVKPLDYELSVVDDHSFKVKFINQPSDYLDIKIYDVIGNLILKESVKQSKNSELEYQFDEIKSKIFVIKVKSGKENLTKKINL